MVPKCRDQLRLMELHEPQHDPLWVSPMWRVYTTNFRPTRRSSHRLRARKVLNRDVLLDGDPRLPRRISTGLSGSFAALVYPSALLRCCALLRTGDRVRGSLPLSAPDTHCLPKMLRSYMAFSENNVVINVANFGVGQSCAP